MNEPHRTSGPVILSEAALQFLDWLRERLRTGAWDDADSTEGKTRYEATTLPRPFWGFALTIYQPGMPRLMVVRAAAEPALRNVRNAVERAIVHPRFVQFDLTDRERCRVQVDFIVDEPVDVAFDSLSESSLDEQRFEFGIDGLRISGRDGRRYILPGDAFVSSILGLGQLRRRVERLFPKTPLDELRFQRFRSISFVSTADGWIRLYRGYPAVTPATGGAMADAAAAGVNWIAGSQRPDGRFVYYYDAATDSHRDHEHPNRDPEQDPYYNLLRHCGGVVTMLLASRAWGILPQDGGGRMPPLRSGDILSPRQDGDEMSPIRGEHGDKMSPLRGAIEAGIDFFVRQLVPYTAADGRSAAYAYYNRKAKLGGSGIGLYMLSLYQRVFRSDRFAGHASWLANHLVNEISESGEFRYYHVYLDRAVGWPNAWPSPAATASDPPASGRVKGEPGLAPKRLMGGGAGELDNRDLFSFYYPGEAVIGLANYCRHVCESDGERAAIYFRLHDALRFLFVDRPRIYREHYTPLPADSWLMMAINDLWDVPEFRQIGYSEPVFRDADQMVAHMYTPERSPFPDYAGSFFYRYGDHPYPDGARAEGLLAAYLLAQKVGDQTRITRYQKALHLLAWATLRLCNTADSVYSAPNPDLAIGGIRFKLTRQWFRVDTIQHVASFFLKFLPDHTVPRHQSLTT